jgi:hypothetical protein
MSVPYGDLMNVSSTLYALLCDTRHLPRDEAIRAGIHASDAKTGGETKQAFYGTRSERSTALVPKLEALRAHLDAAHDAVNAIVEEFTRVRKAIREKLAIVQPLAAQARKEGWMPAAHFPALKKGINLSAITAAVDAYCVLVRIPASSKEDFLDALLSVYNAVSVLVWMGCAKETPPPEEARDLFRQFFRSVLQCKGILGKADKSIEKTWLIIKVCLDSTHLYDLLTLDDLGQMLEIAGALEKVLRDAEPVLVEGTRSAVADVPLREEDE